MLDTNVVSDLMRNPTGAPLERVEAFGPTEFAVSAIVVAELRFGILKKGSRRLARALEAILPTLDIMPWGAPADLEYARLRHRLESNGLPIGPNDMLIAAHALALQTPLVTANLEEFSRVPGLSVIPWR